MARPKKNRDSLLDAELRIRVTAEQHKLIMKAVELEQSDMSAWARPILIKAAKDQIDRPRGQK
jgi:uncharacterized protein (DUF1778 family)